MGKVAVRVVVHLSLISRGRSLLDSFLLLKPEENEGQRKVGGQSRDSCPLAQHDLFYCFSRSQHNSTPDPCPPVIYPPPACRTDRIPTKGINRYTGPLVSFDHVEESNHSSSTRLLGTWIRNFYMVNFQQLSCDKLTLHLQYVVIRVNILWYILENIINFLKIIFKGVIQLEQCLRTLTVMKGHVISQRSSYEYGQID